MRKVQMYVIYDKVGQMVAGWPYKAMNDGEALRTFKNILEDPNSTLSRNPHDFTLLHVGEFDQVDGTVKGFEIQKKVTEGASIIKINGQSNNGEEDYHYENLSYGTQVQ